MVGGAEKERKMWEGGDEVRGLGWEAYGVDRYRPNNSGAPFGGVGHFPCHVPLVSFGWRSDDTRQGHF